jgi:hypothetical protein
MEMCFGLQIYLQHEGLHGSISTEGEHSSMVEDALATIEHGRRRHVMELFEEWFRERYLSEEFIEHHLNEFNALRQDVCMVPKYEALFMELLQYDLHLNTEKHKVNRFVFGLNVILRERLGL